MDESNSNHKFVVFVLVAAVLIGATFACFVGMRMWRSFQEVRRLEETRKNLRKIGLAIHNYGERFSAPPSIEFDKLKIPPEDSAKHSLAEKKLPFETYTGYFVSNKFEPEAAGSFAVIGNQEQFDKIFGVAAVMRDKARRLPKDAFKSNVVLAVIKRGQAVWEFKVESVTNSAGAILLRYETSSTKSDSATFASPLILSIPKSSYSAVQFIENGTPVKTIELEGVNRDQREMTSLGQGGE